MKKATQKQRAPRNRTITLNDEDISRFKKGLIKLNRPASLDEIENKTIHQDIFEALEYLPDKFVVLVLAVAGYVALFKKQNTFPPHPIADNTFTTNIDGYFETCMSDVSLYQRVNKQWTKALSELPARGLYYLDNKFFGYGMCDVVSCTQLPKPYSVKLIKYQKTGEKIPPANSGATANALPVYQTVPLHGYIKIDIHYFSDKNCQNKETASTVIKTN